MNRPLASQLLSNFFNCFKEMSSDDDELAAMRQQRRQALGFAGESLVGINIFPLGLEFQFDLNRLITATVI